MATLNKPPCLWNLHWILFQFANCLTLHCMALLGLCWLEHGPKNVGKWKISCSQCILNHMPVANWSVSEMRIVLCRIKWLCQCILGDTNETIRFKSCEGIKEVSPILKYFCIRASSFGLKLLMNSFLLN